MHVARDRFMARWLFVQVHGDGNTLLSRLRQEECLPMDGGIRRILKGLPNFRIVVLMDADKTSCHDMMQMTLTTNSPFNLDRNDYWTRRGGGLKEIFIYMYMYRDMLLCFLIPSFSMALRNPDR